MLTKIYQQRIFHVQLRFITSGLVAGNMIYHFVLCWISEYLYCCICSLMMNNPIGDT